ncbi:hypothetical protein TNIN_492921 [Trichonephila inaurata madagascariensis]|uniref:Uncharacterized protein n=1 Tax=Trichonephila inaurata madagascariensis TaxID=2747483 RepID=A0A8X6I6D3_9ARAC|nr:hypothetical protein TNIN_492921 [Trichonephila inaurata madagascariensis]
MHPTPWGFLLQMGQMHKHPALSYTWKSAARKSHAYARQHHRLVKVPHDSSFGEEFVPVGDDIRSQSGHGSFDSMFWRTRNEKR